MLQIRGHHVEIRHVPGKDNVIADCLSRNVAGMREAKAKKVVSGNDLTKDDLDEFQGLDEEQECFRIEGQIGEIERISSVWRLVTALIPEREEDEDEACFVAYTRSQRRNEESQRRAAERFFDIEADEEGGGGSSEDEYDEANDTGEDLRGVIVPDDQLSEDEGGDGGQAELDAAARVDPKTQQKMDKEKAKKEQRAAKRLRMIALDKRGIVPSAEAVRKVTVRIDNRAKKRGEKTKRHYIWVTGENDAEKRKELEIGLTKEFSKYEGDTIEHVVHVVFSDIATATTEIRFWKFVADLAIQIGDLVESLKQEIEKIVFEAELAIMTTVLTVRDIIEAIGAKVGQPKRKHLMEVFEGFKKLVRMFLIIGPRVLPAHKTWVDKLTLGHWQDDDDTRRLMVFVEPGVGEQEAQRFTAVFSDVARRRLTVSFRPGVIPPNLMTQTTDDILGESWLPIDWETLIRKAQRGDPGLVACISWLDEKQTFGDNDKIMAMLRMRFGLTKQQIMKWEHEYVLRDGILHKWYLDNVEGRILVLVIPNGHVPDEWVEDMRREGKNKGPVTIKDWILLEAHMGLPAIHKGRRAMMTHLNCRFAWTGMAGDVRKFVKNCSLCVAKKHRVDQVHNYLSRKGTRPFEKCQIDLQGPIGDSGCTYRYLLTCICTFSNFMYLRALKTKSEDEVSQNLLEIFLEAGTFPKSIQSDLGLEFTGRMVRGTIAMMGIRQYLTPAYTPQVNGIVESSHKRVSMALSLLMKQAGSKFTNNWQDVVPLVQFHVRGLPIRETGISPHQLVHLWKVNYPQDAGRGIDNALEAEGNDDLYVYLGNRGAMLKEMHELYKSFMRDPEQEMLKDWQETAFKKGDLVFYVRPLRESAAKFWRGAAGPFRISEVLGRHVVTLEDMDGKSNIGFAQPVSVRRLIYYAGNPSAIQEWSTNLKLGDGAEGDYEDA
ncbi:MAG: DDE-type integrase/transposase/recombinase [bacterium]